MMKRIGLYCLLGCGLGSAACGQTAWLKYSPSPGVVNDVEHHLVRPRVLGSGEVELMANAELTGLLRYSDTRAARRINESNTLIVMGTAAEFKKWLEQRKENAGWS